MVDSAGQKDKITDDDLTPTLGSRPKGLTSMTGFRVRVFFGILAFAAFTLIFMSVGLRWHIYRARAGIYARQELDHTFEAAHFLQAARASGSSADEQAEAAQFRKFAEMHQKAARECTQLRELYENSW